MSERKKNWRSLDELSIGDCLPLNHPHPDEESLSSAGAHNLSDHTTNLRCNTISSDQTPYHFECDNDCTPFDSVSLNSRRSSNSWTDDEFYENSTRIVSAMFDDVDRLLYDEDLRYVSSTTLNAELISECMEWKSAFRHLRVVGTKIDPVKSKSSHKCVAAADNGEENSEDEKHQSYFVQLYDRIMVQLLLRLIERISRKLRDEIEASKASHHELDRPKHSRNTSEYVRGSRGISSKVKQSVQKGFDVHSTNNNERDVNLDGILTVTSKLLQNRHKRSPRTSGVMVNDSVVNRPSWTNSIWKINDWRGLPITSRSIILQSTYLIHDEDSRQSECCNLLPPISTSVKGKPKKDDGKNEIPKRRSSISYDCDRASTSERLSLPIISRVKDKEH